MVPGLSEVWMKPSVSGAIWELLWPFWGMQQFILTGEKSMIKWARAFCTAADARSIWQWSSEQKNQREGLPEIRILQSVKTNMHRFYKGNFTLNFHACRALPFKYTLGAYLPFAINFLTCLHPLLEYLRPCYLTQIVTTEHQTTWIKNFYRKFEGV